MPSQVCTPPPTPGTHTQQCTHLHTHHTHTCTCTHITPHRRTPIGTGMHIRMLTHTAHPQTCDAMYTHTAHCHAHSQTHVTHARTHTCTGVCPPHKCRSDREGSTTGVAPLRPPLPVVMSHRLCGKRPQRRPSEAGFVQMPTRKWGEPSLKAEASPKGAFTPHPAAHGDLCSHPGLRGQCRAHSSGCPCGHSRPGPGWPEGGPAHECVRAGTSCPEGQPSHTRPPGTAEVP